MHLEPLECYVCALDLQPLKAARLKTYLQACNHVLHLQGACLHCADHTRRCLHIRRQGLPQHACLLAILGPVLADDELQVEAAARAEKGQRL